MTLVSLLNSDTATTPPESVDTVNEVLQVALSSESSVRDGPLEWSNSRPVHQSPTKGVLTPSGVGVEGKKDP